MGDLNSDSVYKEICLNIRETDSNNSRATACNLLLRLNSGRRFADDTSKKFSAASHTTLGGRRCNRVAVPGRSHHRIGSLQMGIEKHPKM